MRVAECLRQDARIIAALVRRERRRLEDAAKSAGWQVQAASRLHGLAAVHDGLDAAAVRRLAAAELETGLPDPNHAVDAIVSLGWWAGDRVPPPSPDIVAAELLFQILIESAGRAANWLGAALDDPASLDVERLGRLTLCGVAEANPGWSRPAKAGFQVIFAPRGGGATVLLRTDAAAMELARISLSLASFEPRPLRGASVGPNLLTIASGPTQIAECSIQPRKSRDQPSQRFSSRPSP